ncbi:hypothetical protein XELAEV_18046918mg [Xenopus laevis]|uniref:Uncharacterized protein n=1 Tax=Xenopus laevis TaxID=8355 RepID=A0A974BTV8_XENLA|nr:hypothetical protein XELAEV_18046918mg [Xenopus laevis]
MWVYHIHFYRGEMFFTASPFLKTCVCGSAHICIFASLEQSSNSLGGGAELLSRPEFYWIVFSLFLFFML